MSICATNPSLHLSNFLRNEIVVVISSARCAALRLSRRGESKPILAVHHLKSMARGRAFMEAFEELVAEIMWLLQAQINALERDRALTANEVHDCEQRRKQLHKLNEQLHEFKTRCTSSERDLAQLEAMVREEQEQIKRGLQHTVRIFKQSQSRQ